MPTVVFRHVLSAHGLCNSWQVVVLPGDEHVAWPCILESLLAGAGGLGEVAWVVNCDAQRLGQGGGGVERALGRVIQLGSFAQCQQWAKNYLLAPGSRFEALLTSWVRRLRHDVLDVVVAALAKHLDQALCALQALGRQRAVRVLFRMANEVVIGDCWGFGIGDGMSGAVAGKDADSHD